MSNSVVRILAAACLAFGAVPAAAAAQQVATALEPDTIRVGEPLRVAVRVTLTAGAAVSFPDTLPVPEDVENLATVRLMTPDSAAPDRTTALYTVTAWRPGALALDTLRVPVRDADGTTRTLLVDLPDGAVVSVLPPDSSGLEPKPDAGVLGPSFVWWLWLLAIVAIIAVLGLLLWWWHRRRSRQVAAPVPAVPARERAIAALDEAWRARPEHGRAPDPFYARVSRIMRAYLDELDPAWGLDRTTPELSAALLARLTAEEAARLRDLLREADQVKFARAWPPADEAERFWRAAREFVEGFREPAGEAEAEVEAEVEAETETETETETDQSSAAGAATDRGRGYEP